MAEMKSGSMVDGNGSHDVMLNGDATIMTLAGYQSK